MESSEGQARLKYNYITCVVFITLKGISVKKKKACLFYMGCFYHI